MLSEKDFFVAITRAVCGLSECKSPEGAVLGIGRRIISYACNRLILPDCEVSAISEAILHANSADLPGSILYSTRFPSLGEMKLIISSGVSKLYFFGPISDPETVRLVNSFSELHPNCLEIIRLEIDSQVNSGIS